MEALKEYLIEHGPFARVMKMRPALLRALTKYHGGPSEARTKLYRTGQISVPAEPVNLSGEQTSIRVCADLADLLAAHAKLAGLTYSEWLCEQLGWGTQR